jgi:hypothetical protein
MRRIRGTRAVGMTSVLALLGLFAFGLCGVASAAPTVKLRAKAVPIPVNPANPHSKTYAGTGNILGAGTAIETEFLIAGTEYGDGPPPLRQVVVHFPAGSGVHAQGFVTCSVAIIEQSGPQACPAKSYASPKGEANGYVSLGSERVTERVTVQGFFVAGGLAFYVDGTSPVSIEIVSQGSISNKSSGPVGVFQVPLINSLPGALAATATQIKVKVGAAYKKGKKLVSYATLPKKCPKGGFPVSAELKFGASESPAEWVSSTASYKAPCPKHTSHKKKK